MSRACSPEDAKRTRYPSGSTMSRSACREESSSSVMRIEYSRIRLAAFIRVVAPIEFCFGERFTDRANNIPAIPEQKVCAQHYGIIVLTITCHFCRMIRVLQGLSMWQQKGGVASRK